MTYGQSVPQKPRFYRPSGKFTLLALLLPIPLALPVVAVMAWIYALFVVWNPLPDFSGVGTLVFAGTIGMTAGYLLAAFRSRSRLLAFITGIILGLIGLWLYWIFWAGMTGYGDEGFVGLSLIEKLRAGPLAAYTYVFDGLSQSYAISIETVYSHPAPYSPEKMEYLWAAEAALALLLSAASCLWLSGFGVINEATGKPAKTIFGVYFVAERQSKQLLPKAIAAEDIAPFLALKRLDGAPTEAGSYVVLVLAQDETDPDFNLVTLQQKTFKSSGQVKGATAYGSAMRTWIKRQYVSKTFAASLRAQFI